MIQIGQYIDNVAYYFDIHELQRIAYHNRRNQNKKQEIQREQQPVDLIVVVQAPIGQRLLVIHEIHLGFLVAIAARILLHNDHIHLVGCLGSRRFELPHGIHLISG